MRRAAVTIALVVVVAAPRGVSAQWSDLEPWPELDLTWNVNERLRYVAVASAQRFEDSPLPERAVAIYADWLHLPRWFLRGGYKYKWSNEGDPPLRDHRAITEATLNRSVGKLRLVTRVMNEMRWLDNDGFSHRVRGRLHFERPSRIGRQDVTPYVSDEAFYDSRYGNIARNRAMAGFKTPLWPHTSIDLAYLRQDNYRSSVQRVNAIAGTLALAFP